MCWIICDSVPVCVAVHRLHPCTSAELLAFHYTHTRSCAPLSTDTQIQQCFIDERAPLNPATVDPSRTVDEGEDEDERDDEVSEPIQRKQRSEKSLKTDETAKELRALSPRTASSHASSLRPSDKNAGAARTIFKTSQNREEGSGALQDVSYLFRKGHCEHQRNGFLQVRMAGMRKSNRKKVLKKKDGERNLHFPSCTPDVQAAL